MAIRAPDGDNNEIALLRYGIHTMDGSTDPCVICFIGVLLLYHALGHNTRRAISLLVQ